MQSTSICDRSKPAHQKRKAGAADEPQAAEAKALWQHREHQVGGFMALPCCRKREPQMLQAVWKPADGAGILCAVGLGAPEVQVGGPQPPALPGGAGERLGRQYHGVVHHADVGLQAPVEAGLRRAR